MTTNEVVAGCVKAPETPVIVIVDVPVGVPGLAAIVIVLVPEPDTVVGLKVAFAPEGNPLADRLTVPEKPPEAVIVTR